MFGVYIHIPFCRRKCSYCDFYSEELSDIPAEGYLSALMFQLESDISLYHLKNRTVSSIYFGGGTPSLMSPGFIGEVIEGISRRFSVDPAIEISCESNPATVSANWFADVRGAGVNRISIGVQSFQPKLIKLLGRLHSERDAMNAIAEAQDAAFKSVSIDLMYAMPLETMADLEDDLKTAMTFQTEHISAYQLTVEDGTPISREIATGNISLPSESESINQMRMVGRILGRGGWHNYEISNFAKVGAECRHNDNCWRYGEYLGLGAGAASFILNPDAMGDSLGQRFSQIADIKKYIEIKGLGADIERIDRKTAMWEFIFLGLRRLEGIAPADFKKVFSVELASVVGDKISELKRDGLLEDRSGRIALTPTGIELSNQVFSRIAP